MNKKTTSLLVGFLLISNLSFALAPKSSNVRVSYNMKNFFRMIGPEISKIYKEMKMKVHHQGAGTTLQFPDTLYLGGSPTLSFGVGPDGAINRLNNAGRMVTLKSQSIQLASIPSIRVDGKLNLLTDRKPEDVAEHDGLVCAADYYPDSVPEENVTVFFATPMARIDYNLGETSVSRTMLSPLLTSDAPVPASVEVYEVTNNSDKPQNISLIIPCPSLVNLMESKIRPADQDNVYAATLANNGQVHQKVQYANFQGVIMGNSASKDKMVIAVPNRDGIKVDVQTAFRLNSYKQDLLLKSDGSFADVKSPIPDNYAGAAISLSFTVEGKKSMKIPVTKVLDFPDQKYVDQTIIPRKYLGRFKSKEANRHLDMAQMALNNYEEWEKKTIEVHQKILDIIQNSPQYLDDSQGALKLAALIFNEFSYFLSNASLWKEDADGNDIGRFLECFDYPFNNSADVDWYSMMLLIFFPNMEKEICQRFVDSINKEDLKMKFFHIHGVSARAAELQQHFFEHPEEYKGQDLRHLYAPSIQKGAVDHDLGMMTRGNPERNMSDYSWYNTAYWIDLFPKLVLRVLRNAKFMNDSSFIEQNWETLKKGLEYFLSMDTDGDGLPECNGVSNTFDNIKLFGIDAYSSNLCIASYKAFIKMAEIKGDYITKERIQVLLDKALIAYEKFWISADVEDGKMEYNATCIDPKDMKQINTDVWVNQLDGLWAWISMGEEPFIPEDKVRKILKTIYEHNRFTMGWATARKQNGEPSDSDQGKDVWITSNYVLAQLLDFYGMAKESKDVYDVMYKVIFKHGNANITPESIRPDVENGYYHYIVAGYPRPGAILTGVIINMIKNRSTSELKTDHFVDIADHFKTAA